MTDAINEAGFDVRQTLERVAAQGKFTQDEAAYVPETTEKVCGTCRFFLRSEEGTVGACQVVEGDINWNGHSNLYISAEQEAMVSMQGENAYSGEEEVKESSDTPTSSIVSFLEGDIQEATQKASDDIMGLAQQYPALVRNILDDTEILDKLAAIQNLSNEFEMRTEHILRISKEKWQPLTDKLHTKITNLTSKQETKVEGGVKYVASDYAYVPDPEKSSLWKLRLAQGRSGNITVSQLGRAAAAFSPGGFRGNRVQIPAADVSKVKARIRREYKKLGVDTSDMPESVKEINSFTLLKQEDGSLRWLAIYSNNILDDDNPPEILSSQAHKDFVTAVEEKEADYPELWLWHVPDWKIGVADSLAYSDEGRLTVAIATGTIDKGLEKAVGQLQDTGILTGVSHGMLRDSIERDKDDNKIITRYVSKEISPLPLSNAANKFTEFIVVGEESTMLKEDKREEFLERGVPVEALSLIEEMTQAASKEVDASGLETKQIAGILKALNERLAAIEDKVNGTGAEVAGLKQVLGQTPVEGQSLFGAALKEGDALLTEKPKETKPQDAQSVPFFQTWINNLDQKVEA